MWRGDTKPLLCGAVGGERGRLRAGGGPQNSCCFWLRFWGGKVDLVFFFFSF